MGEPRGWILQLFLVREHNRELINRSPGDKPAEDEAFRPVPSLLPRCGRTAFPPAARGPHILSPHDQVAENRSAQIPQHGT
jgi:hypothetical protein